MLQRTMAMIIGIAGAVIAFVINLLYSSLHLIGRIAGISDNQTHFFWGILVALIGVAGSMLTLFMPTVGTVLLLIAGVAFVFIAGWWALLASPFLLAAAFLAYRYSRPQAQLYKPNQQKMMR